ncbi:MAG: CocE/NonD family hydrolase, partial [Jejuia sp.]
MKRITFNIILIALIFSKYSFAQQSLQEKILEIAIVEEKVMMPMRDGVRLATDIYRPKTNKKVPIIFSRTPYN